MARFFAMARQRRGKTASCSLISRVPIKHSAVGGFRKTHTCFGRSNTADAGLVPRALRHLFLGNNTSNPSTDSYSPGKGHTKGGSNCSYDKENVSSLNTDYSSQVDSNPTGFRGITRYSPLKQSRHSFGTPGKRSGKTAGEGTYVCKCSFYEIYQERVYDLLSLSSDRPGGSTECIVREDTTLGVFVDNCTEVVLDDLAAAEEVDYFSHYPEY